jgi:hypothetical protein
LLAAALRRGLELSPEQSVATAPIVVSNCFTPIPDSEAPEKHRHLVAIYRAEARRLGIPDTTPVLYRVRAGFTLKQHAPLAGTWCHDNFQYLQDWNFPDHPTPDCWLFVIPTLLPGSTSKSSVDQLLLLRATSRRLGLPNNHMVNFGDVGLLSGFLLAHHKATRVHLPRNGLWVRTDTYDSDSSCLKLYWRNNDLFCDNWPCYDEAHDHLGAFALGVELEN